MNGDSEKFKTELFKKIELIIDKQDGIVEANNKHISLISSFERIIDGIDYNFGEEIPRIAVSFNNKLVELGSFYKRRNKSFFDSLLMSTIVLYLEDLMMEGINCLDALTDAIDEYYKNIMSPQKRKDTCKKIEELLSRYRELDAKLYSFDLEKDISKTLDSNANYKDSPYKNQILRNFNSELKLLGLNSRFQIDDKTSSKEYDDFFTDPKDVKRTYYQQVEKIEKYFKENNIDAPFVVEALKDRLLDYSYDAIHYYSIDDIKQYLTTLEAMKNFDIMGEIVESVGRHVALWDSVSNGIDEWGKTKLDLLKMGLGDMIPQIEYDLNTGKYDEYVQERIKFNDHTITDDKNGLKGAK